MNQHSHITPPPGTYTAPNSAPNTHLYQIPTQPRKASSGKSYAHERSHIANQIQQEVQSTITTCHHPKPASQNIAIDESTGGATQCII